MSELILANIWCFWIFISWLNYFFKMYNSSFGVIRIYLFRNWFLNTDNQFAKVPILFATLIILGGRTLSSTELFGAIWLSAALLTNFFSGHIARLFLKLVALLQLVVEWVNWNRCKRLYRLSKPEFLLLPM